MSAAWPLGQSPLLLLVDEFGELIEKVGGVVRPGRGLGVILHTEDRQLFVAHSFDGAVVEIDVGYFDFGRKRLRIDGESVVLRSDGDPAAAQIFDRLVRAAMAEFQFECRSTECEAEDLMAETNAEDR